jgi:Fe-S cluster biogenesis protein NfuA
MGLPRDEILAIVRELVVPLVRADAGQLYVVSCGERALSLHLTGRFSGCPGNTLAKRRVIEPLLLARFPDLRIEISSGPLLPDGAELV